MKHIYFTTSVVSWFSLIIFRMALSVDPVASTVSSGSASKHSTSECSTSGESESSDIFKANVGFSEGEFTRIEGADIPVSEIIWIRFGVIKTSYSTQETH